MNLQAAVKLLNQLSELSESGDDHYERSVGLNDFIGKKVIVRTYSAGVWFGELSKKCGDEVILLNARRMYKWWAKKSISLSAVAKYGIKIEKSKIVEAVDEQWLRAIELTPCTDISIESIESSPAVEAE